MTAVSVRSVLYEKIVTVQEETMKTNRLRLAYYAVSQIPSSILRTSYPSGDRKYVNQAKPSSA